MQLESQEYGIGALPTKSGFTDAIVISKKALEKWRDHYTNVSKDLKEKDDMWWIFHTGKADILTELLKHFDDEDN